MIRFPKALVVTLVASMLLVVACAAFTPSKDPVTGVAGPAPAQTAIAPYIEVSKGTPLEPYANLVNLATNLVVAGIATFTTHKVKDKIQEAKAGGAAPTS